MLRYRGLSGVERGRDALASYVERCGAATSTSWAIAVGAATRAITRQLAS